MASQSAERAIEQPYRPSWINRLIARVIALPVPPLVVYAGLWLAMLALAHLSAWRSGLLPQALFDARILVVTVWAPYALGFIAYLSDAAGRSLDDFRPALDLDDRQCERLRYEFTILPAQPALVAQIAGVAVVLGSLIVMPGTGSPFIAWPVIGLLAAGMGLAGIALTMVAIYQTFRHLHLIRLTYRRANRLKLFQAGQLYAFSTLTLRIGVGWLIIIYTGPLAFPDVLNNLLWMAAALLLVLSIALSFVATLTGIHRRIQVLKTQRLAEVHGLMDQVFAALDRRIANGELEGIADLREAAAALELQRSVLARASTWPWQPGTVASFLTALSLPLLVWLAQIALNRLLGL